MLRVVLYLALLGALFVGAVFCAGNAIGAWEPATVPLQVPSASTTTTGKKPATKKHHHQAEHKKR